MRKSRNMLAANSQLRSDPRVRMRAFGLSFVMAVALGLTGCATNKEARIAPPAQAPAVPQADGGSPSASVIPMQGVQELSAVSYTHLTLPTICSV